MTAVKTLLVKFDADTSAGKKGIQEINQETGKSKGLFGEAAKSMLGFVSAQALIGGAKMAWSAFSSVVGDTIKQGLDQQKVMQETSNTLAHMGSASGQTSKSVGDFADKMAQLTGVSDDVIQHGENVMLTFGNIGGKVFPQATTAALNMSQMLGQDMQSSVIQVGKALNDPIQGITALSRVGVSFTASEKESIKTMMAHGDVAKAQGVIMGELNKQFGGAAVAAGQTFDGQLKRLGVTMDQTKEKIGLALIPVLDKMLNAVQPLVGEVGDALTGAVTKLTPMLDKFGKWFTENGIPVVTKLATNLGGELLPKLTDLGTFAETKVLPAVQKMGNFIEGSLLPVLDTFGEWLEMKVLPALKQVGGFVLTEILPAMLQWWGFLGTHLLPIVKGLGDVIIDDVIPPMEKIYTQIDHQIIPVVEKLWDKIQPVLIPAMQALGWVVKNVVGPALSDAIGFIGTMLDKLNQLLDILGHVKDALGHVKDAIGGAFSGIGNALSKIPHFAAGTDDAPGGMAWVGEHGKELMFVPKGAQVIPHDESMKLNQSAANAARSVAQAAYAGGGGAGSTQPPVIRVENHNHLYLDGQELTSAIGPHFGDYLRQMGMRF